MAQTFYDNINWGFHVFFMLFFFVGGLILWRRARKERLGWRQLAQGSGLIFAEQGGDRIKDDLNRFAILRGGEPNQASQVLHGQWHDAQIVAFNWFYRSDASLQAVRGGFACVFVQRAEPAPFLRIFPESFDNYLNAVDPSRIFIDDAEFSKSHRIQAKGRDFAERHLTPERRRILQDNPDMLIEFDRDLVLIARIGELTPQTAEAELDRALILAGVR